MTSRNHHYISQCYLKGFAQNRRKPKIFVIDTKTKKHFQTLPRNIAAIRDFNRVDIDGMDIDALEKALSGFEGELAPALDRINEQQSVSNANDRSLILNFIALLAVRNPRHRETIQQFQERLWRVVMSVVMSKPEIYAAEVNQAKQNGHLDKDAFASYEDIKKFVDTGAYKIEVPEAMHSDIEFSHFDKLLQLLAERKWTLLKAPMDSNGFITSDHPVNLIWSNPEDTTGLYPPGYGLKETTVLFPISKNLAFMGTFEGQEKEIEVSEKVVAVINGVVARRAKRQIYAQNESFLCVLPD